MKSSSSSKTWLFLLELILMVLFFSISAAICMQMFAAAHVSTKQSNALDNAVLYTQSAAECYKAADGALEEAAAMLSQQDIVDLTMEEDKSMSAWFDDDWNESAPQAGVYQLIMTEKGAGTAQVAVYEIGEEEPIFSLDVKAVAYGA